MNDNFPAQINGRKGPHAGNEKTMSVNRLVLLRFRTKLAQTKIVFFFECQKKKKRQDLLQAELEVEVEDEDTILQLG